MKKVLFIFGQLNDPDVEWLITHGHKQTIEPERVLIEENGAPLRHLFIILTGDLSVRVRALGGREVARAGSGEVLGEMSFIDSQPTSASVVALVESTVLAIPRVEMARKLQADLGFAARFYRAIAMLLSDRLRASSKLPAVGDRSSLDETTVAPDEIDLEMLDEVTLAGSRFDRMLKRLS